VSVPHGIFRLSEQELEHVASFQAALFLRARTLAFEVVSRPTMLSAILRSSARLRAAVRSRTRLSSSRNVTSSTQCRVFSIAQCQRIAWPSGEPFGFSRDGRTVGAARQEATDLAFDLVRAVDTANALDRQHGAQARPAAQGFQSRSIGAGEHPAAHQTAVRVIKGVAVSPAGRANAEASLVEVRDDRCVGQGGCLSASDGFGPSGAAGWRPSRKRPDTGGEIRKAIKHFYKDAFQLRIFC